MKRRTLTKLMVIILALVATLAVFAISAFAAGESATVSTESTKVSRGDTVEFSVSVNASAVRSIAIVPEYDSDVFEIVSGAWDATVLGAASLAQYMPETSSRPANALAAFASGVEFSDVCFTFTLKAKDNATIDDCRVTVDVKLNGSTSVAAVTAAQLKVICSSASHSWSDASCTAAKTCSTCGETEGDALGHDWAAATCQAPKTCNRCSVSDGDAAAHVFKRKVVEEEYLKTAAGCETRAVYYYCCNTCDLKGGEEDTYSYGKELGHIGGSANCTEKAVCTRCEQPYGDFLHSFVNQNTDEAYLALGATCTAKAQYYLSCDCGAKSDETFEAGELGNHVYIENADDAYLKSAASCTAKAVYFVSCSACLVAGTDTFEAGETVAHAYTEKVDEAYLKSGASCTAKAVYFVSCSKCGVAGTDTFENGEITSHDYTENADEAYLKSGASCTAKAVYFVSCSKCGVVGTDTFEAGEVLDHSFGADWKSNADKHWKECACGAKSDEAAHNWNSGAVTKESTDKAEGEKTFTCKTCSRTKIEIMPKVKSNNTIIIIACAVAAVVVVAIVLVVLLGKKKPTVKSVAEESENVENTDNESDDDIAFVAVDKVEEALAVEDAAEEADVQETAEDEVAAYEPATEESDDSVEESNSQKVDDNE